MKRSMVGNFVRLLGIVLYYYLKFKDNDKLLFSKNDFVFWSKFDDKLVF